MKKLASVFFITAALCSFSTSILAQDEQQNNTIATPKWVSDKGYWVIESNVKTPENSVIYFYNNDNELVYKEKLEGIRINWKKRRVLMHLKTVLEQSIASWNQQHLFKQNEMSVAIALRK